MEEKGEKDVIILSKFKSYSSQSAKTYYYWTNQWRACYMQVTIVVWVEITKEIIYKGKG